MFSARLRSGESMATPPAPLLAIYPLLAVTFLSCFLERSAVGYGRLPNKDGPYLLLFVVITPFCATESASISTAFKVTSFFDGLIIFNLLFSNLGLLMALFTFHASLSPKQGSLISSCFMLSFGACLCQ